MGTFVRCSAIVLVLAVALPALGDDQEKAGKQLDKIVAMATDATGRRVVSMTAADMLNVKRSALVQQRRDLNLNYGDVVILHHLLKSGATLDEITSQLQAGKDMRQIANDRHADWKQIAASAKQLNAKVDDRLYKHFVSDAADKERDRADNYDPTFDGVKADAKVSDKEIVEAQERYLLWQRRAAPMRDASLDHTNENAARASRGDPVRDGGPKKGDVPTGPK